MRDCPRGQKSEKKQEGKGPVDLWRNGQGLSEAMQIVLLFTKYPYSDVLSSLCYCKYIVHSICSRGSVRKAPVPSVCIYYLDKSESCDNDTNLVLAFNAAGKLKNLTNYFSTAAISID